MGQKCAKKDKCHKNDGRWVVLALRSKMTVYEYIKRYFKQLKKGGI